MFEIGLLVLKYGGWSLNRGCWYSGVEMDWVASSNKFL